MATLEPLLQVLRQAPEYAGLRERLERAEAVPSLGAIEPARAAVAAALAQDLGRPLLLVTPTEERARRLVEEMPFWLDRGALLFAAPEAMPFERVPWSLDVTRQRLLALAALARRGDGATVIVTPVQALLTPLPPPARLRERSLVLRAGQEASLTALTQHLVEAGYRPEALTELPGSFSRRGGILDIFPITASDPVRLEFFGDMIDSLRYFDPATQRSQGACERVVLTPANEAAVVGVTDAALAALREVRCDGCHTAARADFERDLESMASGSLPGAFGLYLGYLYERPASLLDYLSDGSVSGVVLVDDLALVEDSVGEFLERVEESRRRAEMGGDVPADLRPALLPWEEPRRRLGEDAAVEMGMGVGEERPLLRDLFTVQTRFGGQIRTALGRIVQAGEKGAAVVVTRQVERLVELLQEQGVYAGAGAPEPPPRGVHIIDGSYPEGWVMAVADQPEVALFTDTEISGWSKAPRRPVRRRAKADPFMLEVEPGDYVVHVEHGIGRYVGLVRLSLEGSEKEYLAIEYADGDRLYVPTYQVDRMSRYVGASETAPTLTRIGGADWREAKARARRAVEEIADELLELYAVRSTVPGFAFGEDDVWQRELEASFPYEETEDQLRTISEVKQDMEQPRPMDRLVAGDVGYGKTEVALRAAFKAVMNGKQVAVLVPTTVLAQQHYDTFRRRLAAFPVTVEMLSRFRSEREQQQVIEKLARGDVDIVVGTHRLVQPDVKLKNLGLVVIDEEQRFGVRHKEALKNLRKEVDVITMTATPIPRTMNMALTGLRDLSTIDTPPEDRLAVWTYVSAWDDNLVQRAVRRELARGGQVFLVHDRVRGIEMVANRLQRLVPEARIGIAHGQLPEAKLSAVMEQFAAGAIDVLVCTTIIESGLDIPNANTIIINHADRFGLAQLYQLRGRVGRGAVRAYAYLLFSPGQGLTDVARQRLRAIMEASELGSGLQVAMRDLEIRGAGDILGRRQHGHISAVGFDLYTRLLAQAVAERRAALGDRREPDERLEAFLRPLRPGLQLSLPLEAEIPETYVTDSALRLALYRRLASLPTTGEIDEFRAELEDRFGPPPSETEGLLYQTKIKVLAEALGATAISKEEHQFYVRLEAPWLRANELRQWLGDAARLGRGYVWIDASREPDWQALLLRVLRILVEIKAGKDMQDDGTRRRRARGPREAATER